VHQSRSRCRHRDDDVDRAPRRRRDAELERCGRGGGLVPREARARLDRNLRLSGKRALVTGGSSGIGAATARRFVEEGARVTVADVAEEAGRALADELGAGFATLDVRSEEAWRAVVASLEGLDVLVACAGIVELGGVTEMDEASFRRVLDVNTVGVYLGMRTAVPAMRAAGGGSIVNISSVAGLVGNPYSIGYAASKWAVRGMSRSAALDLAPDGIRVNSVHPGVILTPMTESFDLSKTSGLSPLGRLGEPADVADLIVYLGSDESSFVTGAELVVDGGVTAGRR
jgi:3alpha(or 20beta)-hydroxysteroid dehydrogenase